MSEKFKQHFAYIDKTDGTLVCTKSSYSSNFSFETPEFRSISIDPPTQLKLSLRSPWTYSPQHGFTNCEMTPSKQSRLSFLKKQIDLMQLLQINHDLVNTSIDQRLNSNFVDSVCKNEMTRSQIHNFVEEERRLVKEINANFLKSQFEKISGSKSLAEIEHITKSLRADFELGLYARRTEK